MPRQALLCVNDHKPLHSISPNLTHTCTHTLTHTLSPPPPPLFSNQQRQFDVQPYMNIQKDINPTMRTILVDWLIEVQENFELFHETLYLGVRLVDMYLSKKEVLRENLQLVGATCLLIASKFEVSLI